MQKEIEIKPKKPKLAYVGMDKKTLAEAVPTQVVEVVYPSKALADKEESQAKLYEQGQLGTGKVTKSSDLPKNRLIWTNDNLVALKTLLDEKNPVSGEYRYRNKIDLIYIDPPFMVQNDFVAENSIDIEVDEEEGVMSVKEPTIIETIAYKDTWQNGLDSFLQMMRERLLLMKELLAPTGSIYVHLDWHTSHYVKVLMDEVFDYPNFCNEVVWYYWNKFQMRDMGSYARNHDVLLWYAKNKGGHFFTPQAQPLDRPKKLKRIYWDKEKGRIQNIKDESGKVVYGDVYDEKVDDVWDIPYLGTTSQERNNFPTQKPLELMLRVIKSGCPPNGLVLDAFMGSGTICEAAEQLADKLNCSWIGIDNSKFAVHTARKRLIELNGKPKEKKGEGVYKVRPFTVENMGYYQRGVK